MIQHNPYLRAVPGNESTPSMELTDNLSDTAVSSSSSDKANGAANEAYLSYLRALLAGLARTEDPPCVLSSGRGESISSPSYHSPIFGFPT